MQLVVKKLALLVRALDRLELTPASCVPDSALSGVVNDEGTACADSNTRLDHDLVYDLRVGLQLEVSLLVDGNKARQEGLARYAEMSKLEITVVNAVVAELGTDVTNFDSCEWLERLKVTDRHNVWLHAVITLASNAPSENDSVSRLNTEVAWPEF